MSESGDYDPGPWSGYSFSSARARYDDHVGRSYDDAVSAKKSKKDLIERSLETKCESPVVIACDVTGSMGEWPAVIFSKLPYLDLEGKEYLGKGMEISFAAVGDAYCDTYPLQVRPFDCGKNLEKRLKELVIEGGGGGQCSESYDLAALYYSNNVKMPNAIHPLFIFIGDEGLYESIDKGQAKSVVGLDLKQRMNTKEVMDELKRKYSVYLVRKPYEVSSGDGMSSIDKQIYSQWESYLGADHIAILPEAGRVVDVIFGIMAKETRRIEYFEDELKGRQKPGQVKTVLKSLHSIHQVSGDSLPKITDGRSITRKRSCGKDAKSLL
ncbi:Uncharacterised protein [uncultured archaeon]|nr:Uncharacterised protein [uncultured archaeon]